MLSCFPEGNGSCSPKLEETRLFKAGVGNCDEVRRAHLWGVFLGSLFTQICFVCRRVRAWTLLGFCAVSTCLQLLSVHAEFLRCVLTPTLAARDQSSWPACVSSGLGYVLVRLRPQESRKILCPVFPFSSSLHMHVGFVSWVCETGVKWNLPLELMQEVLIWGGEAKGNF